MRQQLPQGLVVGMVHLQQLDLSGMGLDDAALQQAVTVPVSGSSHAQQAAGSSRPASPEPGSSRQPGRAADTAATAAAGDADMTALPHLVCLDVSCNALQQLPVWLPPSLAWLSAGHNNIHHVPADLLTQLAGSLVGLELHNNQLSALPTELKALSSLQLLALEGNPGMHPDLADKGSGLSWAYRWLADKKQAAATAAVQAHQRHRHF